MQCVQRVSARRESRASAAKASCNEQQTRLSAPEIWGIIQETIAPAHNARVDRGKLKRVRPAVEVLVIAHAEMITLIWCSIPALLSWRQWRVEAEGVFTELHLFSGQHVLLKHSLQRPSRLAPLDVVDQQVHPSAWPIELVAHVFSNHQSAKVRGHRIKAARVHDLDIFGGCSVV